MASADRNLGLGGQLKLRRLSLGVRCLRQSKDMKENGHRQWAVKLPLIFCAYHLAVVVCAGILQIPQMIVPLELPVAPLLILLLYLADKKILAVPNALAIPILFMALLLLWILYGYLLGSWMDRSGKWTKPPESAESRSSPPGVAFEYKIAVVAILAVIAAIISFSK